MSGDPVYEYVEQRVAASLKGSKNNDKWRKAFDSDENRQAVEDFRRDPDVRCLVFMAGKGDTVVASHELPSSVRKKAVYMLKPDYIDDSLSLQTLQTEVVFAEMTQSSLNMLSMLSKEVFLPLLQNKANQEEWSGPTSKTVMDNMHNFLSRVHVTVGKSKGKTWLPLPPDEIWTDLLEEKKQEQAHVLETCVVEWTNQTQRVLSEQPEHMLKRLVNPGPLAEIDFWAAKSDDLNSLYEQVHSDEIQRVIATLVDLGSAFGPEFKKEVTRIEQAREEANSNAKFLATCKDYFYRLSSLSETSAELGPIKELFLPIMHSLLLIFRHSSWYNTRKRLSVIMQLLCNEIVRQCLEQVNSETLFRFIDPAEVTSNVDDGVRLLKTTIDVCDSFKKMFRDYRDKASKVLSSDAWECKEETIFHRLNAFLERCHDILEFAKVVQEFSKLARVNIGGTRGETLTESIRALHLDFVASVEKVKALEYDLMDVSAAAFDDDFYKFRCHVKDLERRLAQVLVNAFEDAANIDARFKILESFDGMLERPIIKDEMDKRQVHLLRDYNDDLSAVQDIFHRFSEKPRVDQNLPPIAGALSWCRGLSHRVDQPTKKLTEFTQRADSADTAEVGKIHQAIVKQLSTYEQRKVEEWKVEIDSTSDEKLQQSLLLRNDETKKLSVNFDKALVRLLREVKYFLLLKLDVHPTALNIYAQAQKYRAQIGNLELIVQMYNEMISTMTNVEQPLLNGGIAQIDRTLERGLTDLNWKDEEVDQFIQAAKAIVSDVHAVFKKMKENAERVQEIMEEFCKTPLIERKSKPHKAHELDEHFGKLMREKHDQLEKNQEEVESLLEETEKTIQSLSSPDSGQFSRAAWREYVADVEENIIRRGLADAIVKSIEFLCVQFNPKSNELPLLDIELALAFNDVVFNAESHVGNLSISQPSGPGQDPVQVRDVPRRVWTIVEDWVKKFFDIGKHMKRVITGTVFTQDLLNDVDINSARQKLHTLLDAHEASCEELRKQYKVQYERLWLRSRQADFKEWLDQKKKEMHQQLADEALSRAATKKPQGLAAILAAKETPDDDNEDEPHTEEDEDEADDDRLPLDAFDTEISRYEDLEDRIGHMPNTIVKDWLRIDARPFKDQLGTWVGRWKYMYTKFLYDFVVRKLNDVYDMIDTVRDGLKAEVRAGDSERLREVLHLINIVRTKNLPVRGMFQPLREVFALLKKHKREVEEDDIRMLDQAGPEWEAVYALVHQKKDKVNELQNQEVDKIKEQVVDFSQGLVALRQEYRSNAPFKYSLTVDQAYDTLYEFHCRLLELDKKKKNLQDLENVFELKVTPHRQIKTCMDENKLLKQVWDMVSLVRSQFTEWQATLWDDIETELMDVAIKSIKRQVQSLPKELQTFPVYVGLKEEVGDMEKVLPIVDKLRSRSMSERHWRELMQQTGKHFVMGPDFALRDLLQLGLQKKGDEVEEIVEKSKRESKVGVQLQKIEEHWSQQELSFKPYKNSDIMVIFETEEVVQRLEEDQSTLQGINLEHYQTKVSKWTADLGATAETLDMWLNVQTEWSSLEPIFLYSEDIKVQLPEDSKRFAEIHELWKELMAAAVKDAKVTNACLVKGRSETLEHMIRGLEKCEKSLNQYLEKKRKRFPRFYFISNSALLDILSNGYNPQAVQKHFGDCFDGIAKLDFTDEKDNEDICRKAVGMHSKSGNEYVEFPEEFVAQGAVEEWLNDMEDHMRKALKVILRDALAKAEVWETDKPREQWLYDYPAQVALSASQVMWTDEVEAQFEAFEDGNEMAMKDYFKVVKGRLDKLIELVLGKLSKCDRRKIITLITVDVHNRDVVDMLIHQKVEEPDAFAWSSQMRYYWESEENNNGTGGADEKKGDPECFVRVADASFRYAYEYVGNTGRLVITPLTDRCYITLTQALRLIMGGAPAGPAGTGKTETTKDLGRAMGLPVYVFNCSEQMNVDTMANIFKGLCQTGSWGCFDEFNRIPIEVLSVVSTQYKTVLDGLRVLAGQKNDSDAHNEFDFMGEVIRLVPSIGAFITMNPGYAGRTELPENLKALFRSCAMVVPDMELICENMLLSEGFHEAQVLSKKFVTLYSLSRELLSKQAHYDWGLRATKAVLRVAGGLRRAENDAEEDAVLMRALRDFNLPKLVDEDKPIFKRLVSDLFIGLKAQRKFDETLAENIRTAARARKLQAEDMFVQKTVELKELFDIRHSVFIIGDAGTGKSEIWQTLFDAFNLMNERTVVEVINPKAILNKELYGWKVKADMHDGVLSTVMRNMSRLNAPYSDKDKWKVIVLDGDIDPEWIESLNTVMDDNKVLTLVSNERIPVTDSMRLLFEIANLDNATPATVSRAGILFINQSDIGAQPFLDSWIQQRPDDRSGQYNEKSTLEALLTQYITPETLYTMTRFKRVVPVSTMCIVQTMCNLLDGLLGKCRQVYKAKQAAGGDVPQAKDLIEANFVFACMWAFGGSLSKDGRDEFDSWWKSTFKRVAFTGGKDAQVFDYYPNDEGKMVLWKEKVPDYLPPGQDAHLVTKVAVQTVDSVRLHFLMDMLVQHGHRVKRGNMERWVGNPVMLVGTAGTGKTTIVNDYLRSLDEHFKTAFISLNAYTDAKRLQGILEGYIDKRSGRIFGPESGKKLVFFIDDLNMPFVDKYNTQSPSALLRQQMDYGGWFDTHKLEKKEIVDVTYLSCMNPTSGSFTINPRLQGHFATFGALLPNADVLKHIYSSVMDHHLRIFPDKVANMLGALVDATLELHSEMIHRFRPSSDQFFYQWNLRELSAVFQGLCMSFTAPKRYTPWMMKKLWEHECTRVFADRLTTTADLGDFDKKLNGVSQKFFKDIPEDPKSKEQLKKEADAAAAAAAAKEKAADDSGAPEEKKRTLDDMEPPQIFTSFVVDDGPYLPVPTWTKLHSVMQDRLDEHNAEKAVMNLELFSMAMEHVCRIVRIIENPRGNAMLVGVGGSGKQSLARLATFICGFELFQIAVTQSYGMNDLRQDLQDLYRRVGLKNQQVVFLLTDTQIVNDEWLVYINDFLSSGFIADLFTNEDKERDIFSSSALKNEAKQAGIIVDNKPALEAFFLDKVRSNLHIVLSFSPVGSTFRNRVRKFPGLINGTVIDYFHKWPHDALVSVAERFLGEIADLPNCSAIAMHMANVHRSVDKASKRYLEVERRYNYTTPKSFLELIDFYKQLLVKKRQQLQDAKERLQTGIGTLDKTSKDVAELQEEMKGTLVITQEKQAGTEELIIRIRDERKKVDKQQDEARVEQAKADKEKSVADAKEANAAAELKEAEPAEIAAKNALNLLNKKDIDSLKSFKTPKSSIVDVINAVIILKNQDQKKPRLGWKAGVSMMSNVDRFINELKAFDATNVRSDVKARLYKEFLGKSYFQNPQEMAKISSVCVSLCSWVTNVVKYNEIFLRVEPLRKEAADAAASAAGAQKQLDAVNARLKAAQDKLDALNSELEEKMGVSAGFKNKAEELRNKLDLAMRFIGNLKDENERWRRQVKELEDSEVTLAGDVLLAAAFVSYVGAFNQRFRLELWHDTWIPDLNDLKIPITDEIDPLTVLADEASFARWKNEGLPADRISMENGAIITQCSRWPLMIDPQLQGIKWIKSRQKDLVILQLGQGGSKWVHRLRQAVENGQTVLFENVSENLDATLNPLLSRAFKPKGKTLYVTVGGEEVAFDPKFRMYLQTKLSNPHYQPETSAQCTIINFIVTEEGLEEQLLALVVNKEKPELEERRTALVHSLNEYRVQILGLEDDLLEKLKNAPADILSDVALIEGVEKTKKVAKEIAEKEAEAKEQEKEINISRSKYNPVAQEGSWLYFLLIQLHRIDHMYQYSLDAFTTFFFKAIERAEKSDDLDTRVKTLRKTLRLTVFQWVNRGLFERHKLIFSTQLCFKLLEKGALAGTVKEKFNAQYLDFLVRAPQKLGDEKKVDWMSDASWRMVCKLSELPGFEKLASDLVSGSNRFKDWYSRGRPERDPLPLDWRKLDDNEPFKKLLIVRALRNDRMTAALQDYVCKTLPDGRQFTETDAGKSFQDILSASLQDSTPTTPIFFILSSGADPISELEHIAGVVDMKKRMFRVALGEGQDVKAEHQLELGHKNGNWVVLENIHLMPTWLPKLEQRLDDYAVAGSHEDFRVFLSAEPSGSIPIGLLERSIKLTNEPPQGLKANLQRAFATMDRDDWEMKDTKVKNILFGLCHFHSVLIERMKFGPKGWNRTYPFSTGDLRNSTEVLSNYMERGGSDKVPWADLRYIFGEILYGGHITDDWDRLLCKTYLDFYMKDDLLDEMQLFPFSESFPEERFQAPPAMPYSDYKHYIDDELKFESPVAFGLHPNAEVGVKTTEAEDLFSAILSLQPRDGGGAAGATDPTTMVTTTIETILQMLEPVDFDMEMISGQVVGDDRGPYQNVFLQECTRMNILVREIKRSLNELMKGIDGELQFSERMDKLLDALYLDKVPASWERLAYPSMRSLGAWADDLLERYKQLEQWTSDPVSIPNVVHIDYLFNPQSFLTAIMQTTAQRNKLELDKLVIQTDVTRKSVDQIEQPSRDGAFICGLFMEGARWNLSGGFMEESAPREMFSEMPVINCRAILRDKLESTGVYQCPVYRTARRGPTYIFDSYLRTKLPAAKWVLAGVVLVMEKN